MADSNCFDGKDARGWSMRHGHCKQLKGEINAERMHGRAKFSCSISGKSSRRMACRSESQSWGRERHRNKYTFKSTTREADDYFGYDDAVGFCEEIRSEAPSAAEVTFEMAWQEPPKRSERQCASMWEEAEARAASAAQAYSFSTLPKPVSVHLALTRPPVVPPATTQPAPFPTPPANAGAPRFPEAHGRVVALAQQETEQGRCGQRLPQRPTCWQDGVGKPKVQGLMRGKGSRVHRVQGQQSFGRKLVVEAGSVEYAAVEDYFRQTLNVQDAEVIHLHRIQNLPVYSRYRPDGGETVMFHGCGSQANEDSIIQHGFQVSCCRSGGAGFGTWFAYSADYSNGGYAFQDVQGMRHIFVCVVSYSHTVTDNCTMRVVGQDCAYPLWLLQYKVRPQVYPIRTPALQADQAVPAPRVKSFFVVRDGQWEPEVVGGSGSGKPRKEHTRQR